MGCNYRYLRFPAALGKELPLVNLGSGGTLAYPVSIRGPDRRSAVDQVN